LLETSEIFGAREVFRAAVALARFGAPRKGAENSTRSACAPHLIPTCVQNAINRQDGQCRKSDCADTSALWNDVTCRVEESGDTSPHSKFVAL
jgi:hypothetical protein